METLITTGQNETQENLSDNMELLYRRWAVILKNYANYYLNDTEASSSIVNDLFIRLWDTDLRISNIKAYLFRSVKNASLNYLTGESKKTVSYVDGDQLTLLSDQLQPISAIKEDTPQQVFLQHLIRQLPEKRRLVFRMHRIEGFSYEEIAELLQISNRTVEDHLAKSMKFIHENCQHFFNG